MYFHFQNVITSFLLYHSILFGQLHKITKRIQFFFSKPHVCPVPSCQFTSESNLEFENHYNGSHRYSCHVCSKTLPSPRLLDLHIQEKHDSFFAVLSEKKPSVSYSRCIIPIYPHSS